MSSGVGEPGEGLEALMIAYQQSDQQAAALLVDRLSPRMFQFFLAQTRSRSEAEDLLQDFWLRIHKARATFRPGDPLLPWAYAIARRTKIDQYRRTRRFREHEFATDNLADAPVAEDPKPDIAPMAELLKSLPDSQRETLLMLKVSGMSLEEVARATNSSVGSVKQKAHRAYEALRQRFGKEQR